MMDTGKGYFEQVNETSNEALQEHLAELVKKHENHGGTFYAGQNLTIEGSKFRVLSFTRNTMTLRVLPKDAGIQPRGEVTRNNKPTPSFAQLGEPQFSIHAWCPDEEAKLPPEQVHFVMHWTVGVELPPIAIRFKSPDSLGFFIEELIKYRRMVWPESEKVTGEK
jgi:hypothetical protein